MDEDIYIDMIRVKMQSLKLEPAKSRSKYYHLNLFAKETGGFTTEIVTHWVGFTEGSPKREIREPSLVKPSVIKKRYDLRGEPLFVINTDEDFIFFILITGGNALIERSIFEKHLPHLLNPSVCTYSYGKGYTNIAYVPKEKLNRAPDPKLRMQVFNRDSRRCKICGASPTNNEHVELHIHHILPYAIGGLTDKDNLITLCHTCHKGLFPPVDYSLFDNIGVKLLPDKATTSFIDRIAGNILALCEYRSSRIG